jgi:hypothetical protein
MLRKLARSVAGPFIGVTLSTALGVREQIMPSGDPRVYAMGPDPDRLLVVGAGAVRGLGVASYELAIGGHLARRLSALTGRGADVTSVGVPGISIARSIRLIEDMNLSAYDAIVLMVGIREASGLSSVSAFRRDLLRLIATVRARAPQVVSTVLVSIPELATMASTGKIMGPVIRRHVERLNAQSEAICAATGTGYVSFVAGTFPELAVSGYTAAYDAWSAPIAAHVHAALKDGVAAPTERTDEQLRQESLDAMRVLDTPPSEEIDFITRVARDLFGVAGASVNFIDHDRQWTKSAIGFEPQVLPRSETFCDTAIRRAEILVVPDATLDPRFKNLPAVLNEGIRFYAGYPIEAPNGQRIGTLCLFDGTPRSFTLPDESLLRELALRVQAAIWEAARVDAATR